LDLDSAAVVFRDLANDGEAEPGARVAPRRFRAVEAVEDERLVGGTDAGAVVADRHLAVRDRQLDAADAVAPLGGVLDEVPDRPLELLGIARHRGRLGVEGEGESGETNL